MREGGPERDLDAALATLIESALRRAAEVEGMAPAEQARLLAQGLAVGLRELVRAPLREALQAGYELGWRAALEAQRQAAPPSGKIAPPSQAPCSADPAEGTSLEAAPATALEAMPTTPLEAAPATPPEPAPVIRAVSEPADTEAAAEADQHAHQVRVEISPLPNFSAVNRFHAAVAGIADVADTTMVTFRDGRLTLRVEHPDGQALAGALQALDFGPLRVVAATSDRLELALDNRPPSAVSRWRGRDIARWPAARGRRPSADR